MIVVVGIEGHADGARLLQWRGRADGEKIVHLPDRHRLPFRRDCVAEPPSRAAEGLGEAGDRDRALRHPRPRRERVVLAGVADVLVAVSYTHLRAHETDSYLVC